ncbi:riboflavin transporter MCH5 [Colletotrichum chrysophilum]|uniref:Riboflavin transporter MCH5 n=1 Tax=Colletotrichum chrysophilum TaxID=1836956 RepID=A0AAD9AWL1_9PEZI|nr:riboflavin transporter MCH5 [Colletotrichum chrysophilum]
MNEEPAQQRGTSEEIVLPMDSRQPSLPNRVLSHITTSSNTTPGPPPDGGRWAWLCGGNFRQEANNCRGVINSFGVFQSHYAQTLRRPPSDISWIGSIQIFLLFFIGTFTGRLTDAGLFRPVALVGSILVVLGSIATSFSTQYWQIFLSQGVCVGLGNGCLFCPTIALVSTYFQKRRSLAIGFTACGSTTGGVLFPAIVRQLLPLVGFGWMMRAIGLVQLVSLAIALLSLKPRLPPRTTGQLVEWEAFKELEYTFYGIGMYLCFWGSYFAFFFTAAYARDILGMSYTSSLDVLMIMSGVGIVGRILPSYLADRVGALTVLVPTAGAGALTMFTWLAVDRKSAFYAWAAISGIILGGIQAVFPSALASLTADPSKQGTRIGMIFTIVSFSVLSGPPIGGALVSALGGRYLGGQVFSGCCLTLGTVFLFAAREAKRRSKGGQFWMKV